MSANAIETGSDRNSKKGFWVIGIATLVALIAIPGGIWIALAPTSSDKVLSEPSLTPISPSATVPPTTTSSVVPEPPLPQNDFVAQGMPESFSIVCGDEALVSVQGLTTTIRVLAYVDESRRLRVHNLAVPDDTVALVKDDDVPWAVMPGSDADAVSIWGHANDNPRMVFNPIAEFRGDPSDCQAVIVVPAGVLTYGFVQSHMVTPKSEQFDRSAQLSTMEDREGKLLVSTCSDADSEIIWEFTLQSSQAY